MMLLSTVDRLIFSYSVADRGLIRCESAVRLTKQCDIVTVGVFTTVPDRGDRGRGQKLGERNATVKASDYCSSEAAHSR